MWLLTLVALLVASVRILGGRRRRPRVIGVTLIVGGFATHAVFEIWASEYAGRIEMCKFSIFEALLFLAGLGTVLVGPAAPSDSGAHPFGGPRSGCCGWRRLCWQDWRC
jgi:hypothetical protein